MSCIEVSLRRQGQPMAIDAMLYGSQMDFRASQKGMPVSLATERRWDELAASMDRMGKPVEFRCGLVCSVSEMFYLRVEPEYIWLLPENDFSEDVVVYANVSWTIE
jgi:hypothetical protein